MLSLKVLGGLSVEADGAPATGAAQQRRPLALLAILAGAGRNGVSRDKLAALLWPERDAEHARNLLKQACYTLRRDLQAPDLILGGVELRLNPDLITSDIQVIEEALGRGDPARAVEAYTGPYLDGFYLPEAGEFERLVEETRVTLRRRVSEALESLATAAGNAGDSHAAVQWWRRLAALDPLSARSALGLLRALSAAGERSAALEFGRVHEKLLRDELDTAPDAAVSEILERLRREGTERPTMKGVAIRPELPAAVPAPRGGTLELAARRAPGSAKRITSPLAIGLAVLLSLGSVVAVAASRKELPIDPDLVAVAPFDVLGDELELWREGLVDVISRNLDGAGPFRTVTPTSVIRLWNGRADQTSAVSLGERTGAGVVIFGQIIRAGPDSVRLEATILDVRQGRTISEVERTDRSDRIERLADSMSVDVVLSLTSASPPSRPASAGAQIRPRLSSVGTTSLPALKSFLRGEQHLRRLSFDSAIASYDRAIALDSGFALALRKMGVARAWGIQPDAAQYTARAALFNHRLSPRDSLMIAADSQPLGDNNPALHRFVHRKLGILHRAINRYPEDPEVWFEIGDLQYHFGFIFGSTWKQARQAFDRAIALDSTFALAYIHPIEIALTDNDPGAALRYVRGYLAVPSATPEGAGMRLLGMLLERARLPRNVVERELAAASLTGLRRAAFAVRSWPDADETQIEVARHLLVAGKASHAGAPANATIYAVRGYQSLLADALVFRGHLREARALVGDRLVMQAFMELAHLGVVPPDSVETALARGVHFPDAGDHMIRPAVAEAPCYRTMDAALWWASRKDMASLHRLLSRDSAARAMTGVELAPYAQPVPGFVVAAIALARGDTVKALERFLHIRPSCPDPSQLHQTRFRLLVAAGRDAEAAALFDSSHYRRVPMMLERARIAERLGDRATARKYYQFVVQAWLHADPELQPVVAGARAALARLDAGRRR
jgi:serine/threonine-protein kinase